MKTQILTMCLLLAALALAIFLEKSEALTNDKKKHQYSYVNKDDNSAIHSEGHQ